MNNYLVAVLLGLSWVGEVQAQINDFEEAAKLIDQAKKGSDHEAVALLRKSLELANPLSLTGPERKDLANRFTQVVRDRRLTRAQLEKVFGPMVKKQVARQVCYRRYVEQWRISHPLPLRISWDCPKGQDPTLRSIQPE